MPLQKSLTKIASATATGVLASALALGTTGTAFADDTPQGNGPEATSPNLGDDGLAPAFDDQVTTPAIPGNIDAPDASDAQLPDLSGEMSSAASTDRVAYPHRALYKGRVTSPFGLRIRSGPSARARVLGTLPQGALVWIQCKVNSQEVGGNPRWYKLAKGYWVWSPARFIRNIGPAPRFCHFRDRQDEYTVYDYTWESYDTSASHHGDIGWNGHNNSSHHGNSGWNGHDNNSKPEDNHGNSSWNGHSNSGESQFGNKGDNHESGWNSKESWNNDSGRDNGWSSTQGGN
jgi:hypothetical protein